jgi:hypothetical protein
MKSKICFLLLSIISLVNVISVAQFSVNYLTEYHPHINKAESFLIEYDYADALVQYDSAFTNVERGFMKDYFNAAVCATYLGEVDKTFDYLLKVASKGISLDFIKAEVAFSSIQRTDQWRDFELKYLEERRKFEEQLDTTYQKEINTIVARDQWFRKKNAETFADTIATIDLQNAFWLRDLIEEKGFPGEDEIGCGTNGFPVLQYDFYDVIRRQTPESQAVNFSNQLMAAARNGKILPHFAAHIMATINGNDVFFARNIYKILVNETPEFQNLPFGDLLNEWIYVNLDEETERSINELRLQNGMETLPDYRKKILFSLDDNKFLLPYRALAGMWYITDPDVAATYVEGAIRAENYK